MPSVEELLKEWDAQWVKDALRARCIRDREWRFYALRAGVVDGIKWKSAKIAREYKLSRARVCQLLKGVECKLIQNVPFERKRLYRNQYYWLLGKMRIDRSTLIYTSDFLSAVAPRDVDLSSSWWDNREIPNSVVYTPDGKAWVAKDANVYYGYAIIWCREAGETEVYSESSLKLKSYFTNYTRLLIHCGDMFYAFDHADTGGPVVSIFTKQIGNVRLTNSGYSKSMV